MSVTIYATNNVAGQIESNENNIAITPLGVSTNYILLVITEKQNCNNVITALFQNITTNCNISKIDFKLSDLSDQDLINGIVNLEENGLYHVDVYYQASSTNLDVSFSNFSYKTCLDVCEKTSCEQPAGGGGTFSCEELNSCPDFNAKIDSVAIDSTLSGDGTVGNELSVQKENGNGIEVNDNSFDLGNILNKSTTILGGINNLTWGSIASPINSHTINARNTVKIISSTDPTFANQYGQMLLNTYGIDIKGRRSSEDWYSRFTCENGQGKLLVSKTSEDDESATPMGFILSVITDTFEIVNQNTKIGLSYSDVSDFENFIWETHTLVAPPVFEIDRELTPATVTLTGATTFNASSGNNGTYSYNSVTDVNFTIDNDFLEDGKFAYFTTENIGNFTFVTGSGSPVIVNKNGLFESDGIHSQITVTNVKGVYKIGGDLK